MNPSSLVGLVQEAVDARDGLLAVVLALDGVDGAARSAGEGVLELGVLAEAAGVAEEGVLLVVVDAAALVALEHVLPAVGADAGVGGHGGRTPWALNIGARSKFKG